jgi:translation initiation factor IF-1
LANNDRIELEGTVQEHNKGIFRVKITDDYYASCTLSGKMRQNAIKIIEGDKVKIEVSEYDTNKGRITYRIK